MKILDFIDPTNYVHATRILVALWVVISSTEWLAARKVFGENGLLPWRLMRIRRGRFYQTRLAELLFSPSSLKYIILIRLCSGFILLISSNPIYIFTSSFLIFLASAFISSRASVGGDGSDQMGLLATVGLSLMAVGQIVGDDGIIFAAVLLLGGQACLAYFTAGAAKLISPVWRNGVAVVGVMNTQTYGHDFAAAIVARSQPIAKLVCWLIILTEILFPIIVFSPGWLLTAGLFCAGVFHFINSYFMGLNTFIPTFIATYPSVIMLNFFVRHVLGFDG